MKIFKLSFAGKYFVTLVILLIIINIALGLFLINQSNASLKTIIQSRMLDISNTAASMLDGDVLEKLQADDVNTEGYQKVLHTLKYFRDNIELKYIYCIRDMGNKQFTFSVDPTELDPGEFGYPVVYTEALYQASLGQASVDKIPYEDDWGRFYSSYSPVFNSKGKVAGIVAVDFAADWYDAQVNNLIRTIVIATLASLLIGVLIAMLFSSKNRKKLVALHQQLNILADSIEELFEKVNKASFINVANNTEKYSNLAEKINEDSEHLDNLGKTIFSMQNDLKKYIDFVQKLAYTDGLTAVKNKTAYLETINLLNDMINSGNASFSIAIFDINQMKLINDNYGHECGDLAIIDAAHILIKVFSQENIYRIGGDEFIAILNSCSEENVTEFFQELDNILAKFNSTPKVYKIPIKISKGAATYIPAIDLKFNDVFKRADVAMYQDKANYYKQGRISRGLR
ncbi:MAG: diguanylate cyclase [Desulfovibrionaceae bacterium]|nr:diguanylate cyclase [Desulfovibrionaceae bacterium]